MRLWFSGPRFGLFRPGVSFNVGARRRRYAAPPAGAGSDSVYVIRGEHGHVKIGVSRDPASRLAALQTGSSFALSLAWSSLISGDAYSVEQEAHAMLAQHRLAGEWFDIAPEGAIGAVYGAAYRVGATVGVPGARVAGKPPLPFWTWAIANSVLFGVLVGAGFTNLALVLYAAGFIYVMVRNN